MKKKIISVILACVMLMTCVVSVYAYSDSVLLGHPSSQTNVSISWAAETVTASNGYNPAQSYSYCKAYINYDNGEYFFRWDTSITTAISATATHSVYPPGATRILTYSTEHKIRVLVGGNEIPYHYEFVK